MTQAQLEKHRKSPQSQLERNVVAIVKSVIEFHERFDLPPMDVHLPVRTRERIPYLLSRFQSHQGLLMEEVGEVSKALNHGEIDDAIKELVDVLYVAIGSLYDIGDRRIKQPLSEVIDKNAAKTLETHVLNPLTGKIVRK